MALVAYGSSDDSDYSETEEDAPTPIINSIKPNTQPKQSTVTDQSKEEAVLKLPTPTNSLLNVETQNEKEESDDLQISDEEDELLSSTPLTGGISQSLPAPKNDILAKSDSTNFSDSGPSTSLLKGLPKPRSAVTLDDREDELEDFVKKKEIPIEKPPPKKKAAIKITIPSLPQEGSDEEDDQPVKKRAKTAPGTGLFSLLPAPLHAPLKEMKRSLMPHSLSKRPKPPTPIPRTANQARPQFPTKSTAGAKPLVSVVEEESDEEDDGTAVNFFSLGGSSAAAGGSGLSSSSAAGSSYMSKLANMSAAASVNVKSSASAGPSSATSVSMPASSSSTSSAAAASSSVLPRTEPHSPQTEQADYVEPADAPLSFKNTSGAYSGNANSWGSSAGMSVSQMYNLANMEQDEEEEGEEDEPQITPQQAMQATSEQRRFSERAFGDPEELADVELTEEEQMMRLAGKRLFKREQMNIIDVKQDDQVSRDEMLKSLTEEGSSYVSQKNIKDSYSNLSKRKHQITYLGHLAKAREVDLKNSWAANKMSKRQSAMKYGF